MSPQAEQILKDALRLSLEDRAKVAAELLASLDEPADEGVEAAWAAEIERRARRVLAGESQGTDRETTRARLAMFNEAAADVTNEDLEERDLLLGGFSGGPAD